jgi:uncharacterized protein (DUF488 family)
MRTSTIFTSGYEGLVLDQLLDRLTAAGVALLLDVRAIAASRKPGFSKNLLRGSLEARGLQYLHVQSLGTPKAGRIAARAGRAQEMARIFDVHMATPPAQAGLADAIAAAASVPTCLLCFERDAHMCHRRIVAEAIASQTGQAIEHL